MHKKLQLLDYHTVLLTHTIKLLLVLCYFCTFHDCIWNFRDFEENLHESKKI